MVPPHGRVVSFIIVTSLIVPVHISAVPSSCQNIICDPGYEAIPCDEHDPTSPRCSPCHGDTYMNTSTNSSEGLRCKHKRICSEKKGLTNLTYDQYDHIDNTLCRCLTEYGYQNPDYDRNNPSKTAERCFYCGNLEKRGYISNGKCDQCPVTKYLWVDEHYHRHCTDLGGFRRNATDISTALLSTSDEHSTDYTVSPTNDNGTSPLVITVAVAIPVAVILAVVLLILYKCYPNSLWRRPKRAAREDGSAAPEETEMMPVIVNGFGREPVQNGFSSQSQSGYSLVPDESMRTPDDDDFRSVQTNPGSQDTVEAAASINTACQQSYKVKLEKNRVMIVENMKVDEIFLSYLRQGNFITPHDHDRIKKMELSLDQAAAVVDLIKARGPKAFSCLVWTLFQTKQKYIAEKLDGDLFKKLQTEENEAASTEED